MNHIKMESYIDGINDALYDISINSTHNYNYSFIDLLSNIYDFYYKKGYSDLYNFIISLYL